MLHAEAEDERWFGELLAELERRVPALSGFFDAGAECVIARAPGRLDVMGGIADYSGSLVLELPLREAALAAAAPRADGMLDLASVDPAPPHRFRRVSLPLAELSSGGLSSYEAARRYFAAAPERAWAGYLAGVVLVAMREHELRPAAGLSLLISSSVPEGKGVSSSAAIEVAALTALVSVAGVDLAPEALAFACQKAENLVAGAPCGVMDQMTAALGKNEHCLVLRCQPGSVVDQLRIPPGLALFGIDSGVRHAVSGADYGAVRCGAFMGYRVLAERAGLPCRVLGPARVAVEDARWGGYLANLTVAEFAELAGDLPERMDGAGFLERYQGTTDPVTRVEPDKSYPVRAATAHPVGEHERMRRFCRLFAGAPAGAERGELGALMFESHESYSRCGLGSEATDRIVELVRESGSAGLYGAKITGGGSGGTVAVLADSAAAAEVERVAERYARATGRSARVFRGSSNGAAAFGVRRRRPA